MRLKLIIISILFFAIPFIIRSEDKIDQSKFQEWYDFESINDWTVTDWDNNGFSNPLVSTDYASHGKSSLQISFKTVKPVQQCVIQVFGSGDMTGADHVKFDVYNSSSVNMKVYLMLKNGQNWVYHESIRQDIKPGWNKDITYDLKAAAFGSGGVYNSTIKEAADVRRFGIIFEPEKASIGYIYLDNVMLSGNNISKLLPEVPVVTGSLTEVIIDDFETPRIKWSAASNWSCATKVEASNEAVSTGNWAMKAWYDLKQPGQNAVFMLEDTLDMTDVSDMKVDIYYPYDFPSTISMSLSTGDKWVWQEYMPFKLKKGWNKDVTFYFNDKKWKNENSKWQNSVNPENLNSTRRLSMLLVPANMGPGYIICDNIRMSTTKPEKLAGIMPYDLNKQAFSIWNSFEKGTNWQASSDQSGATTVKPADGFGNEDRKGMKLEFATQNNVDKAMYIYYGNLDFSTASGIKFDVYNPTSQTVQVSLAFQWGDNYTWIETKTVGISPGWNKDVYFDFLSPSMKSELSNWNYTEYFDNRDDIRRVIVQVYPNQAMTGCLYVTDFMLARHNFLGEAGKVIGATFANSSSVTYEPVKYVQTDSIFPNINGTFENASALNSWGPSIQSGWGASSVELSSKYATQGKQSLKLSYKDYGQKSGLQYPAPGQPVNTFDISGFSKFSFDVYNPGRQMTFNMAFKGKSNGWYQTSMSVYIRPGWNRNVTVDLNNADWQVNTYNSIQASPVPLGEKSQMENVFLIFNNDYEGSLYIDNMRWGLKSAVGITGGNVTQDVNIMINPNNNIEGKVTLRGSYNHMENNTLEVNSAHLILRGFGNELSLFSGENAKLIDDVFGVVDAGTLGVNMMGATLAGTIFPLNTSYLLSGISLNNSSPWAFGSTYLATARVKTYFLDKNFVGLVYMNDRRGYDEGANIFTGDYEQAAQVYGADTNLSIALPYSGLLSLKGEMLSTSYAAQQPVYLLPGAYVVQNISSDGAKNFIYGEADLRAGYLQLTAFWRQIDQYFDADYFSTDYSAGHLEKDVKATYTMDEVFPFSYLKMLSSDFEAFVRNTQLMCEYDETDSYIDTYGKHAVTVDLKNDESLALYNYHFWFMWNSSGTAVKIPTYTVTGLTKMLFSNMFTIKLLGRYVNEQTNYFGNELSAYQVNINRLEGMIEASMQLTSALKMTANYKATSSSDHTSNGNWYAEMDANLYGSLSLALTYGGIPFTGYWYDDSFDNNSPKYPTYNDTTTIYTVSLKGRF
jgi:hypothetical protein